MSATATVHGSDHMSSAIFDTLAYAKKLKAAGFTEQQAEVQTEAIYEIIDKNLATKQDVKSVKHDIKLLREHDIKLLREDVQKMEERLTNKLTIRFGSMMIAAVMILAVLIKIL